MVATAFSTLGPWSWWILGLALLGLEVLVAGTFFLWFGVAALVVGTVALLVAGFGIEAQIVAWVVLSFVLLFVGRRYVRIAETSDDPLLNDRLGRFVGREFTLREPIVENRGRLEIEDTTWRISGPDLPAGTRVKVTATEGTLLVVAPAG